ncbi:MAG: RdgB/HAM1 family non-canonical purine NTP pyrophosphatase [Myxococcota bacterium]
MKLLVATGNAGKVREFQALLEGFELVRPGDLGLDLEVEEDRPDFEGNARKKARAYAAASGLPTLADDSGLEVDALGGAPGVHSARYAGAEGPGKDAANNAKLLAALEGVTNRRARFRCVLVLVHPDGRPWAQAEGACEGRIGRALQGEGGFGYDPLFYPDDAPGRAMAELSREEKNALSHRGRATRHLANALTPKSAR